MSAPERTCFTILGSRVLIELNYRIERGGKGVCAYCGKSGRYRDLHINSIEAAAGAHRNISEILSQRAITRLSGLLLVERAVCGRAVCLQEHRALQLASKTILLAA